MKYHQWQKFSTYEHKYVARLKNAAEFNKRITAAVKHLKTFVSQVQFSHRP